VRVSVLASGSSGNCTLFESTTTSVIVDAGIGPRALEESLISLGAKIPDAIVITHAHQDHVGHAARIAKRRRIPVYMTEATAREVPLPAVVDEYRFETREPFAIGDLVLSPLPLPHDAANVAIKVSDDEGTACVVTDVGEPTGRLVEHLRDCDVVLLESNYDEQMLAGGPYPWGLKQRVASARGHLSNKQAHMILRRLTSRTHTVVLVHLSETNNTPDHALDWARDAVPLKVNVRIAPPRDIVSVCTGPFRRSKPPVQLSLL
jgi:phosphoribosyl 1,2-cyclic phosphodiesterase